MVEHTHCRGGPIRRECCLPGIQTYTHDAFNHQSLSWQHSLLFFPINRRRRIFCLLRNTHSNLFSPGKTNANETVILQSFLKACFFFYYFFLSGLDTLHNLRCVHYLDALPWWKSLSISWMNLLFVDYVWTLPGPVDSLHCCNGGGCWEVDTGSLSAIGVHLPCSLCHWRERCKGAFAHSDNSDFNLKMISSYLEKMWRRMLNISRFLLLIEVQFNRNGWIILNSSEISFLSFLIHCVKQTFFLPNAGWILCHSTFWHNMES